MTSRLRSSETELDGTMQVVECVASKTVLPTRRLFWIHQAELGYLRYLLEELVLSFGQQTELVQIFMSCPRLSYHCTKCRCLARSW